MKRIFVFFFFLSFSYPLIGQIVYEHISNMAIYRFLDEMANEQLIDINDVIKPYSRKEIYDKLFEIKLKVKHHSNLLNKRQLKELNFYLQAYVSESSSLDGLSPGQNLLKKNRNVATALNPLGLYYKDSVFTLAMQPIFSGEYAVNKQGNYFHRWWGASMYGYVGKSLGFYTSLRDNDVNALLINPDYFVQEQGVPYKNGGEVNGVQYSEARGGITYSWKWGTIGIVKDNPLWGLGYNGTNIQSGRTPSFAMIKLDIKPVRWFVFNYYHGWLVSQVVDSSRSYWTNNKYRTVYYPKYIAANMFTFYPVKHLNISFGNSVVYSDVGGGGPHLAYMIPFLFYKSVDHTLNATNADGESGQNAQMFINVSSRNINHLHLYFTLFIDDFSVNHIKKSDELNYFSYKGGFRLSNFPFENMGLTAEWTRTNPYVFQHVIETTTYETNLYNMGHYLRDNSREYYLAILYKPYRGFYFELAYILAQHGTDANYAQCANDPNCNLHKFPFIDVVKWENKEIDLKARYEVVANTYIYINYRYSNISGDQAYVEKYSPEFYWGKTSTFTFGANIGF